MTYKKLHYPPIVPIVGVNHTSLSSWFNRSGRERFKPFVGDPHVETKILDMSKNLELQDDYGLKRLTVS